MMLFSWLITALIVSLIVGFGIYIAALLRLPTGDRPLPLVYDRMGRLLGKAENPDYHINPGEPNSAGLTIVPVTDPHSGTRT